MCWYKITPLGLQRFLGFVRESNCLSGSDKVRSRFSKNFECSKSLAENYAGTMSLAMLSLGVKYPPLGKPLVIGPIVRLFKPIGQLLIEFQEFLRNVLEEFVLGKRNDEKITIAYMASNLEKLAVEIFEFASENGMKSNGYLGEILFQPYRAILIDIQGFKHDVDSVRRCCVKGCLFLSFESGPNIAHYVKVVVKKLILKFHLLKI